MDQMCTQCQNFKPISEFISLKTGARTKQCDTCRGNVRRNRAKKTPPPIICADIPSPQKKIPIIKCKLLPQREYNKHEKIPAFLARARAEADKEPTYNVFSGEDSD
jgi:hypothetical protein